MSADLWNRYGDIFGGVFLFAGLCYAINNLKKKYAQEVYLIWYINAFFFLLFLGLSISAERKGVRLTEVCGSYEHYCTAVYSYLTNATDEITLLFIFAALSVGPQLIAYVLSVLSGSAYAPKFLSQVEAVVIWSFVKFLAAVGGILTSQPLAKLFTGTPLEYTEFGPGLVSTGAAFYYAYIHVMITDSLIPYLREELDESWYVRVLTSIHIFFTRNARDQQALDASHEPRQESALPKT